MQNESEDNYYAFPEVKLQKSDGVTDGIVYYFWIMFFMSHQPLLTP
jgi:hypothetical protein